MGFPEKVKEDVLVACNRHCSLCHKFCATNIEIHHITAHADGGEDSFENAIPLCFDCHARVRQYDPKHPKGTKFTETELKRQRDEWYKKVNNEQVTGVIGSRDTVKKEPLFEPIVVEKIKENEPTHLHRVQTGKHLIAYAEQADALEFDYDDPENEAEQDVLLEFANIVHDAMDMQMYADITEKMNTGFRLNTLLHTLEEQGFFVFSEVVVRIVKGGSLPEDAFRVWIVNVVRKDNENVTHSPNEE